MDLPYINPDTQPAPAKTGAVAELASRASEWHSPKIASPSPQKEPSYSLKALYERRVF